MNDRYEPVSDRVKSTDDVEIQTYDYGGQGPLLVMCHATGFCAPAYEPFIESLTDRFRCVALDFRAHGRSTQPSHGHMSWAGMASDINAVLDHYSPGQPVVAIGHSLGGGSLVLAEAAMPGRLSAIWTFEPILFEGSVDDGEPDPSFMSDGARRRRSHFADRDEVYQRYSSRPPLSGLDDRSLRLYIEHGFSDAGDGGVELRCSPEFEARTFEQHRNGAAHAVMNIDAAVAVAIGRSGTKVSDQLRELLDGQGKVEVVDYADISHFGPLEQPERLADEAATWLLSRPS